MVVVRIGDWLFWAISLCHRQWGDKVVGSAAKVVRREVRVYLKWCLVRLTMTAILCIRTLFVTLAKGGFNLPDEWACSVEFSLLASSAETEERNGQTN